MMRRARGLAMMLAVLGPVAYGVSYARASARGHPSSYVAVDPSLRSDWLYFYPARSNDRPRAMIVLFGNDVAFWAPHQELAWRLSGEGYSVVGVDIRKFLQTLPEAEPQRDSAFPSAMSTLIQRARHELHADALPVVLGGHSFGAELAFWVAVHAAPSRLAGVLALNSRSTGHLFITRDDYLNHEASGPWSFSTVDAVRALPPAVRVALVRGSKDPFRRHDPEFEAAGGARLERYEVPLAGHSMRTMLIAGPVISRAVRFLTDSVSS